jgi:DNA-binding NtrC family response regulator
VLAEHFIEACSAEMNTPCKRVNQTAMDTLKGYHWKGNVRDLENVIERAMILCEGDTITQEHLRLVPSVSPESMLMNIPMEGTLEEAAHTALHAAETLRIRKALESTHGNKTRAAEMLKVSYKTLLTKIKDYGIEN